MNKGAIESFEAKTDRGLKTGTWWKIGCTVLVSTLVMVIAFSGYHAKKYGEILVHEAPSLGVSHASSPGFHEVFLKCPSMATYLYSNQIQHESKVDGGVIYTRMHPGGDAESGFAEVLAATMPKFDQRFSEGVNAYWTLHIRLARTNSGSKWHSYAKGLPTGIQTIKRKTPTSWMGERVTGWSSVHSFKVIVY